MTRPRALVVGPGPVRPGANDSLSGLAAEAAEALAARYDVVALDGSPTSSLLFSPAPQRRYLEPVTPEIVVRVAAAEAVDATFVLTAGPVFERALAAMTEVALPFPWLGPSPRARLTATRHLTSDLDAAARVVDLVVATDGTNLELLASFECRSPPHVALADSSEARVEAPSAALDVASAHVREAGLAGIATLRCLVLDGRADVIAMDWIDPALWGVAGLARGVRAGALLAELASGKALTEALRLAEGASASLATRVPSFDFEPFPSVDRTPSGVAKSCGGVVTDHGTAPIPPASARRVVLVGPGPLRASHGPEATLAVRLAAREARRLGCEVVVVSDREGAGAEVDAHRVHRTSDVAAAVHAEGDPADVLVGFGADPARRGAVRASDVPSTPTSSTSPPIGDAVEVHVVVLTDGAKAEVVGSFEHVERAAIAARDACAVFPAFSVDEATLLSAEAEALEVAKKSGARGLVTACFAFEGPRHTLVDVEYGVTTHALSLALVADPDLVAEALRVALGAQIRGSGRLLPRHVAVEEHVFPFAALGVTDTRLDRKARASGSVLAVGETVARAYGRALHAMGATLQRPPLGQRAKVVLAGGPSDGPVLAELGRKLYALGFDLVASGAAADWLARTRVPHAPTADAENLVARREVVAVAATAEPQATLRYAALVAGVTCFTTAPLLRIAVRALELEPDDAPPRALEDWLTPN